MKYKLSLIEKLMISVLFAIMCLYCYAHYNTNTKLKSCSRELKAIVIDKYSIPSKGFYIKYRYRVQGKEYITTNPLANRKEVDFWTFGDTINIFYSCEDHSLSKYKKLE